MKLVKESLNEALTRYYYDPELGIPYILGRQQGTTSKFEFIWPDGEKVILDKFSANLKKISEEEYKEAVKRYYEHEKFMKQAYKDAKEVEREENEEDE